MILDQLPPQVVHPPILKEAGPFVVKLAETPEEVNLALRLRYRVFNLEQGKGLDSAIAQGLDLDEFDELFLHLLVVEQSTGRVVGTYRLHLGIVADSAQGCYSAREFDISGMAQIGRQCIELGRSCVDPEFRRGAAVSLLWQGVAEVLNRSCLRYLLGCVSLETTDPAVGWAIYHYLIRKQARSELLVATPKAPFVLARPPQAEVDALLAEGRLQAHFPPLFKGYLRLGAAICGEPAIDREFGTIDFLILIDTDRLPERYRRHFKLPPLIPEP